MAAAQILLQDTTAVGGTTAGLAAGEYSHASQELASAADVGQYVVAYITFWLISCHRDDVNDDITFGIMTNDANQQAGATPPDGPTPNVVTWTIDDRGAGDMDVGAGYYKAAVTVGSITSIPAANAGSCPIERYIRWFAEAKKGAAPNPGGKWSAALRVSVTLKVGA